MSDTPYTILKKKKKHTYKMPCTCNICFWRSIEIGKLRVYLTNSTLVELHTHLQILTTILLLTIKKDFNNEPRLLNLKVFNILFLKLQIKSLTSLMRGNAKDKPSKIEKEVSFCFLPPV